MSAIGWLALTMTAVFTVAWLVVLALSALEDRREARAREAGPSGGT